MSISKVKFVYVTYIVSTPEKIFEAIVKPEIARQYWGHENVSDWKPGSKWEHVRFNDAHTVNVAGNVIENTPPKRLVISWANPANYHDETLHSRVTFDLEPFDDMVRLTVTHDEMIEGSDMVKAISNGWPRVLSSMKSFLETGKALDVFAKPKAA